MQELLSSEANEGEDKISAELGTFLTTFQSKLYILRGEIQCSGKLHRQSTPRRYYSGSGSTARDSESSGQCS